MRRKTEHDCAVELAEVELGGAVLDAVKRHGLTATEVVAIMAGIMLSWANGAVRPPRRKSGQEAKP